MTDTPRPEDREATPAPEPPEPKAADGSGDPASHSIGDILILSNFTQGGGATNIQVYEVVLIGPASGQAVP